MDEQEKDCGLGDTEYWPKHWDVVKGVTCVVCPDCAFTFDADHTDDTPEGGYSCPCCESGAT